MCIYNTVIHIMLFLLIATFLQTHISFMCFCLFAVCVYVFLSSSVNYQNSETNINLILNNNPKRKPVEPVLFDLTCCFPVPLKVCNFRVL
jgi:Ca2+/Na+ antiporter